MGRRARMRKKAASEPQRVPAEEKVPPSRQNRIFFVSVLLGVLFLSALLFRPFFTSIVTGLLLAYFSFPIYRAIQTILRLRVLSGVLALLVVLALFVVPFAALGIAFIDDAQDFATSLDEQEPPPILHDALYLYAQTRVDDPQNETAVELEMQSFVQGLLEQASAFLIGSLPDIIGLVLNFFLGIFIVSFVMFYFFVDRKEMGAFITRTVPLPPHQTSFLLRETKNAIDAIFIGQLAGALLQGAVGGLGFWIFGVPNFVFWGAIMAVLSLLPVVGAFLVWAPAGVLLIATGDLVNGVLLLVWGTVLVSNVDNVVKPILIGGRANIHPLLVIIGVFGGIAMFGVIGFVVGPLLLGLAAAFLKVWNTEYHDGNGWVYLGKRPPGAVAAGGPDPAAGTPRTPRAPRGTEMDEPRRL